MPDDNAPDATEPEPSGRDVLLDALAEDEQPQEAEPETYPAEYVRELRDESAKHRVKAKRIDDANARLIAAYATTDGRLVDVSALAVTDDLLGSDGLVDPDAVTERIGEIIAAKPYLQSRRPTTPIPQGVREDAGDEVGLFGLIRERV
jgi:hypothetical protein